VFCRDSDGDTLVQQTVEMCPRVTDGQRRLVGPSHDGCVIHVELNRHS